MRMGGDTDGYGARLVRIFRCMVSPVNLMTGAAVCGC